jgi:uncharacterized tellurite resistance protein B-like protein
VSAPNAPLGLVLGRVLIAAAWADGELSPPEREALQDLLFTLPDLDGDSWRALAADIDRPFPPEHLQVLLDQLRVHLHAPEARARARTAIGALADRVGSGTAEAAALRTALEHIGAHQDVEGAAPTGGWWSRVRSALREHTTRLAPVQHRELTVERALRAKITAAIPEPDLPDPEHLRQLSLAAAILAHVVRLDDVVEAGERNALRAALQDQYGLDEEVAGLVTELALDEVASGIDLHALLRDFSNVSTEDERQRFLAAVFRVAAGDGRASYDEIEEVRRIGRGLLLSHRHFIAAKLTLPDRQRET